MVHLVPLVTLADAFEARVLAARLGADGIICQLRGAHDSPYPIGSTVVLVERDHLAEASALLAVDEMDAVTLDEPAVAGGAGAAWMLIAGPVLALLFMLARTLSV